MERSGTLTVAGPREELETVVVSQEGEVVARGRVRREVLDRGVGRGHPAVLVREELLGIV